MASKRPNRPGVTLVEVLVVLAILALGVGLLLAGVQKTRDAAARASCASRLRQLALAAHQFESAGHVLPAGCAYPRGTTADQTRFLAGFSWHSLLLPYIEQDAIWREILAAHQHDPIGESAPHYAVQQRVVRLFLCPSESRVTSTMDAPVPWALTSYLGVCGTTPFRVDGVLNKNVDVRMADITDGTSSTIMMGERPPGINGEFSGWYANWGDLTCNVAQLLPAGTTTFLRGSEPNCPDQRPSLYPGSLNDGCAVSHYWSLHAGGTHFAFADGHVAFVKYASADILPALATRAGRESVATFD